MKELYSLLLIFTPIKKVPVFQKLMSFSITFLAINKEDIMKDFDLRYFLEVKAVAIRTKIPSMINHMLLSLFSKVVGLTCKFITKIVIYCGSFPVKFLEIFKTTILRDTRE